MINKLLINDKNPRIIKLFACIIALSTVFLSVVNALSKEPVTPNIEEENSVEIDEQTLTDIQKVFTNAFPFLYNLDGNSTTGQTYGGNLDYEDIIHPDNTDNINYYASKDFQSLDEMKNYLKQYLSAELVEKSINRKDAIYVFDLYVEKDEKLYCLSFGKNCGQTYQLDNVTYQPQEVADHNLTIRLIIPYTTGCEDEKIKQLKLGIKLEKIDDQWKITNYEEQ